MRNRSALAVILALALPAAWPAAAQEQTAAIEGVVKDATGSVLPGASVQARHESGRVSATVTAADGSYRFPALFPGRYEMTAHLPSFQPARIENIILTLGHTATVNLSLKIGGVTEELQVTAEAPLIDVTSSARGTNLRDEAITKIPRGRDFTTLVIQAPGVNSEVKLGGISIDGASGSENRYIIDGAETTDLQSGVSGKSLITDFVEEVQVKSSGYTAEFGGSTGGVISVITKSGTNRWHGDVGTYLSSSGLGLALGSASGGNNNVAPYADGRPSLRRVPTNSSQSEYVTYPKDSYRRLEPGFTLGGPLMKDRMWFFVGYEPTLIDRSRTGKFNDNVERTNKTTTRIHYMTASVAGQLSDAVRARMAFNGSPQTTSGRLQSLDGTSNPTANYAITDKYPNRTISGNLDYAAKQNLLFSARGGYFLQDYNQEGIFEGARYVFNTSNVGLAGVPQNLQQRTGYSNVPTNSATTFDRQKRLQLQADGTAFLNGPSGRHQVKFGLQFDRIANDVESGETGNRVTLNWDQSLFPGTNDKGQLGRGQFGFYQVRSNGVVPKRGFITQGNVRVNNLGLFLQDSWTISNRLTLNLGVRTEREDIPSYADPAAGLAPVAIKFSFADKIAPRAGFAYDVKGDGNWKIYGSWGIFYDIMKLDAPRGSFGGDKWLEYYYSLDTPDWPNLTSAPNCPPACPGTLIRGPVNFRSPSNAPGSGFIEPDLKPMRLQEAALGVEHELRAHVSVGFRYVHKQVDRAIEDVGSLDAQGNEIYTLANPGFGVTAQTGFGPAFPKAKRDYDAAEIFLNKRMADRWSARVSYQWSRLFGNYSGLAESDENGRTSPNGGRNFDYPIMVFDDQARPVEGMLPTDRTHQVKAQVVYDFKFGTSLGANVYAASGTPISREAAFVTGSAYPVQYRGRGSDGRTPMYKTIDLYLQHEIKLGGEKRLTVSANALNVLGFRSATNVFTTQLAPGQSIDITPAQFYEGVDTATLITAQKLRLDPRFLQASEYQQPRQIRLSARLSF
jgi:outer membrane receptor protein involved in Fe transport